jgi:hypothetical protein
MKIVVSEDILKDSAFICGPDSSFLEMLKKGEQYKKAGLTPVYVFDDILGTIDLIIEKRLLN